MTAMIETMQPRSRRAVPTVDIAGTDWPVYKLQAVAAAVLAAVLSLAVFTSMQTAAWVSGVVLISTWWIGRYRAASGMGADGSNPAGIS
ncbi:hypothetical protein ABLE92_07095 [Gordonia sp. VNQ95]|uniref:hypothetical protein n=1 Tax=Gordonia TaxID=2053 RepID=UPI0032B48B75